MNGPLTDSEEDDEKLAIQLSEEIMSYDEFLESKKVNATDNEAALYSLLLVLVVVVVLMVGTSAIVCFTDKTCKNRIPTTTNLLNSTFTAPFLVTGMNAAIVAHGVVVAGVFYRTRQRSHAWSAIQVIMAVFAYLCACISLFVSGKTGWNSDWGNIGTVIALAAWMICVQFALKAVYVDRIHRERKLLRASLVILLLYIVVCIVYIVLRAVPVDKYVNEKSKQVGILVSEILTALTMVTYVVLTVIHTKRVRFSLFYKPKK